MLTTRGRVMVGSTLVLYPAARLLGIDEMYLLVAAAGLLPAVAVLFVRVGRRAVRFRHRVTPVRVFAGGTIRIEVSARNDGRAPSPPLRVHEQLPRALGGTIDVSVPSVRAGATAAIASERPVPRRGRFDIGPLTALVVDPLGLAQAAVDVSQPVPLTVYPAIEQLAEVELRDRRTSGGQAAALRPALHGDEFFAVRQWQDGDDMRKIHWRTTARRGEVMIRQDETHPLPRATIFVDTRADGHRGDGRRSSFEWALSAAGSVLWELARQGFAVRLALADAGPTESSWGREATNPGLTMLALATPHAGSLAPAIKRIARRPGADGVLIAIISPPTPDLLRPLTRLSRTYAWCGAILLDAPSFIGAGPRDRARWDQQMADADRELARARWFTTVAGAADTTRTVWESLTRDRISRPRQSSLGSF